MRASCAVLPSWDARFGLAGHHQRLHRSVRTRLTSPPYRPVVAEFDKRASKPTREVAGPRP